MNKEKVLREAELLSLEANSPVLVDLSVEKSIHDCIGLFNCSKQSKCSDYELCLKKYLIAEARNETLQF